MNSAIIKRSVVIGGKKTSVSLEDTFWLGLKEIAVQKQMPLASILDMIADGRDTANLSSAIRHAALLQPGGPVAAPGGLAPARP